MEANPEEQGAGDQGMMFGYALMKPKITCHWHDLSHKLLQELILRRENNELRIYVLMLNLK
jgi:S-adenosylmethionine synthetase